MRLTAQERAARVQAFRRMNAAEKLEYIFSYYKLPIVLFLILLYIAGYGIFKTISRKEVLLYVGFCNVAVSEELELALTDGFVTDTGDSPQKKQVYAYPNLYLSENPDPAYHEYAYASRMKLQAAVHAKQLDVVLMNREAYDMLSGNGYLMELSSGVLPDALYRSLRDFLTENKVVLEDNELALALGEEEEYRETAVYQVNGIDLSQLPLIRTAELTDAVFLGILPNSPRLDTVTEYLVRLASGL